jgi:hypothetical protein
MCVCVRALSVICALISTQWSPTMHTLSCRMRSVMRARAWCMVQFEAVTPLVCSISCCGQPSRQCTSSRRGAPSGHHFLYCTYIVFVCTVCAATACCLSCCHHLLNLCPPQCPLPSSHLSLLPFASASTYHPRGIIASGRTVSPFVALLLTGSAAMYFHYPELSTDFALLCRPCFAGAPYLFSTHFCCQPVRARLWSLLCSLSSSSSRKCTQVVHSHSTGSRQRMGSML